MHLALTRLLARPIAHRGLHACGRPGAVENSPAAAEAAIAAGYGIECDVQLSADGEAMVFHDARLDRLTEDTGPLSAHGAAALSRLGLRGGTDTIPTLAAFLAAIDGRTPLVVEIKAQPGGDLRLAARALELACAYDGPIALESFDPDVVVFCRDRQTRCPVGLVGPPEDGAPASDAALAACHFVSWSVAHVGEIAARRHDLPRSTWTVRTSAQQHIAEAAGAQIVFEGFVPSSGR